MFNLSLLGTTACSCKWLMESLMQSTNLTTKKCVGERRQGNKCVNGWRSEGGRRRGDDSGGGHAAAARKLLTFRPPTPGHKESSSILAPKIALTVCKKRKI